MKTKKIITLMMACIMLISLSACSGDKTQASSGQSNTSPMTEDKQPQKTQLNIAYQTDPEGLDPQRTAAASTFTVTNNIYDTLVGATPKWEIIPRLAEDWQVSKDGMEITFNLKKGVLFHNGREMKAKDVEYSFNRLKGDESPKAKDYKNIKEIKVIDDYTIKFVTENLDVELVTAFAYPWTAILAEETANDLKTKPIGTGPFKLTEWIPQQSLTLERNDDYYGEKAKLKTVKYVLIPDATSLLAGLQAGNLDIIPISGNQVELLKDNSDFKILAEPMNAVQIMSLNTDNKILSNEKVRQAMSMAINKDEIIEAVQWGYGDKIGSHLPPTAPDYVDTNEVLGYNVDKAKELLKEAGYENGFTIGMKLPKNYQLHVDAGQIIANQLSKIGITVNIELIEWGQWLNDVYGAKNFETTVVGHTGRLDSHAFLSRYYSDSNDYISLKTGELDSILDSALKELDKDKRKELYKQAQMILAEKLPAIYIQTPYTMLAMAKNVEGMHIFPIDIYDMKDVYFTE